MVILTESCMYPLLCYHYCRNAPVAMGLLPLPWRCSRRHGDAPVTMETRLLLLTPVHLYILCSVIRLVIVYQVLQYLGRSFLVVILYYSYQIKDT